MQFLSFGICGTSICGCSADCVDYTVAKAGLLYAAFG